MKVVHLLAAMSLAACTEVSAPVPTQTTLVPKSAFGDVISNETTPISFIALNACNGEQIIATGTVHTMLEVTAPSNGSFHTKTTVDYKFSGIGQTTGAKYEGGLRVVDKEIVNSGAATVFEVESSARLIGQGSVPNTWVDVVTAFTIDANGELTHNTDSFSSHCN